MDARSDCSGGTAKRNLPSWMSSEENDINSRRKKPGIASDEAPDHAKRRSDGHSRANTQTNPQFSKLLEGVVFVLSGFVNPERSNLRSQALDMGAEYRQDWTSDSTLLVCAFPNTPKFRQVESDNGTIVSKRGPSNAVKPQFSPSKIKEWAIDDLNRTVSWLESQEEKPGASEVKAIAAEGIITCLQDAMESLKENKDIRLAMEQWMFIPHVVKELAELEPGRNKKGTLAKEEIRELAATCKRIYEGEFRKLDGVPKSKGKQKAGSDGEDDANERVSPDDEGFDSDRTIEMTEEEIELACKDLRS